MDEFFDELIDIVALPPKSPKRPISQPEGQNDNSLVAESATSAGVMPRTIKQVLLCHLKIHKLLSQALLCGKSEVTSKGKSLAPNRKLQKALKKEILNLRLQCAVLYFDSSSKQFEKWFTAAVVHPYVEHMPNVVQFMCKKLEIEDEWLGKKLARMR